MSSQVHQTCYEFVMARMARVIAVGYPHHITQRGNRRQKTFFCDEDYAAYLDLMTHWCQKYKVKIWAWCLMPNYVHLIAVPKSKDGLGRAERPLEKNKFVDHLEKILGRRLKPPKSGPKKKAKG